MYTIQCIMFYGVLTETLYMYMIHILTISYNFMYWTIGFMLFKWNVVVWPPGNVWFCPLGPMLGLKQINLYIINVFAISFNLMYYTICFALPNAKINFNPLGDVGHFGFWPLVFSRDQNILHLCLLSMFSISNVHTISFTLVYDMTRFALINKNYFTPRGWRPSWV